MVRIQSFLPPEVASEELALPRWEDGRLVPFSCCKVQPRLVLDLLQIVMKCVDEH